MKVSLSQVDRGNFPLGTTLGSAPTICCKSILFSEEVGKMDLHARTTPHLGKKQNKVGLSKTDYTSVD